jgi:hypothetical protein
MADIKCPRCGKLRDEKKGFYWHKKHGKLRRQTVCVQCHLLYSRERYRVLKGGKVKKYRRRGEVLIKLQ